jgi:hypothetical protein
LPAVACNVSVGPSFSPASLPQPYVGIAQCVDLLISASPPSGTDATRSRLPCHPPSWLEAASHTCFLWASATTYLTTWPHHCLPGRPSANDAAVFQRPARPWGALHGILGGPWPTQKFLWVGHNAFGPPKKCRCKIKYSYYFQCLRILLVNFRLDSIVRLAVSILPAKMVSQHRKFNMQ